MKKLKLFEILWPKIKLLDDTYNEVFWGEKNCIDIFLAPKIVQRFYFRP